jgi:hypothetical protein
VSAQQAPAAWDFKVCLVDVLFVRRTNNATLGGMYTRICVRYLTKERRTVRIRKERPVTGTSYRWPK